MRQHLLKMLTFDLPKTSGVENTNSSKYESLLNSVVKACEDLNWKTKTIEKKFASLINEQRELKVDLKKRDDTITELYKQIASMQERELSIMKELNAVRCSNSDQLEAIPESQEEIERLEQHIMNLESELRETESLKEEIARLKDERAAIERQVHFTEASLHNEENVQISTGHELQQALQDNDNLQVEVNTLLGKLELLEKELTNFREMSEQYAVIKDMYEKDKLAYQEVINIKTQLEDELLLKQDCLQKAHKQNEELALKNDSLLSTVKSQEEAINKNTDLTLEYSKLQELIAVREEELYASKKTSSDLESRLNRIDAARAALEAENVTFISQLKCQEEAQAQKDLQLLVLEKNLANKQSELDGIYKEYRLKQQELETFTIHNLSVEHNNKELKKNCDDLENTLATLKMEMSDLIAKNSDIKYNLDDALQARDELTKKCAELVSIEQNFHKQEHLQREVDHLTNSLDILGNKYKTELESNEHLKKMCASLNEELQTKKAKEQELLQLREDCLQKESLLQELSNSHNILDSEYQRLKQEVAKQEELNLQVKDLQSSLDNLQKQYDDVYTDKTNLKEQLEAVQMQLQCSQLVRIEDKAVEPDLNVVGQLQKTEEDKRSSIKTKDVNLSEQLSQLITEREELIHTLCVKHTENLEYHGEIQRLNSLLSQEITKTQTNYALYEKEHKSRAEIEAELIQIKKHLENVEQTNGPVQSKDQECEEERGNEVQTTGPLNENDQAAQKHEQNVLEMLKEEHSKLLAAMQQETTRNIYLQNEVQELTEKENSLLKELERLRSHLMAVEDGYTQDVVAREKEISDLQSKLASAEDRIKGFNTALTSASVRANQHVETLQDQTRLIGQQRDDIQMKLCAAEDQIQRQMAALINLQAVLEQFQRDKEQEMATAKAHLQMELKNAEAQQATMLVEVANLQKQLSEAKEGLGAAARLGEQLDKKSQVITELKEEVNRLHNLLLTAEKREESASLNAEAKVDRHLLKNLLIGYLTAPNNTKPQTLRILSTVLDFTPEDRARAGLEPGPGSSGSWLHRLLHPIPGAVNNEQSLSEAFVRFLESESRPQPQIQLLQTVQEEEQRKQSTSPVSSGRSSISLTEVQLPTFTQFPVVRSSSSILKDVLKDSH